MLHQGEEFTLFVDIPTMKMLGFKAAFLLSVLEKIERERCTKKGELFEVSNAELMEFTDLGRNVLYNTINSLKNEGYINVIREGIPPVRYFSIIHNDKGGTIA
jgi:hypothetical protein